MKKVILIKNPKRSNVAEQVLVANGFTIVSNWIDQGIYKKDGINFRTSFPIWEKEKVRIEQI